MDVHDIRKFLFLLSCHLIALFSFTGFPKGGTSAKLTKCAEEV